METTLLSCEAALEDRERDLQRSETQVAILQAEVEQVHSTLQDTENLRTSHILARQSEGFRVLNTALTLVRRRRAIEGFFTWRACVIDRAAWRLGMARRAAFAGNAVPPPPRRKLAPCQEAS